MIEGTQVGAYRLLKPIGEGGMGSVWLAEHIALGRRAALKMLHPEFSNRPDIVTRFFNEARAATSIADPGIVQIFDFGQHIDGSAYIVMELLDGEPLDRRLKREGALSLADGLRLMRQVASTLGAAHACGIVHRDLKPENIFIVRDPEVPGGERAKVLDFGIAKLSSQADNWKTQTGTVIGTPLYMSPEQCRGAGVIDARSDIYQLGCLLMTMITGIPPFQAEGCGDLIVMHLREKPPLAASRVPGLPPVIDEILQRCLAKAPDQRYASMHDLGDALLEAERAIVKAASNATIIPSLHITFRATPTTLSGAAAQAIPGGTRTRAWRIAAIAALVLGRLAAARLGGALVGDAYGAIVTAVEAAALAVASAVHA
jgi:serine/threonine protein kinase